jgi:hypothetical protein
MTADGQRGINMVAKLIPSPLIPGEFIADTTDLRAIGLLKALGALAFRGQYHLTPARAIKYRALFEGGWWAVDRPTGPRWYQRGDAKPMRLSDAMRCMRAMQ